MPEPVSAPLLEQLRQHGQAHLVRWWDELSGDERRTLTDQLVEVDLPQVAALYRDLTKGGPAEESPAEQARRARQPQELIRVPASDAEKSTWAAARATGNELLKAGRVGVILVAGGEGTRLGFPHPKGEFPIGPVSGKTLFQMLAEQVVARAKRAGRPIPYYVMTSHATHAETVSFFERHKFFGLDSRRVHFFRQGRMPAVDRQTGKLLLASKHELALNPDGHGGLLTALSRAKLLEAMRQDGIDFLYYHQIDNPLARVCDPAFLGFHAQHRSEVSTKVVAKLSPEERMGVVVDVDGRSQIIEYSDLPAELAAVREADGQLRFWAGSTAMHVFSRSFFDRLHDQHIELPFHRAIKKVPYLDDAGAETEPAAENAVKFERFIFDVLPLAERSLVVEARREDEFCPLKNKSGDFSREHVQQSLSRLYAGWLRAAGARAADDLPVEIGPLYALDADDVAARTDVPRQITQPVFLDR